MKIVTGIDLHSNNALRVMMDEKGQRLLHRKLPCDLDEIVRMHPDRRSTLDPDGCIEENGTRFRTEFDLESL